DCCNEFWNVSAYVAKGLLRKELLFALDHFNQVLRPELLRMISWNVGIREGFNFSVGKSYKFMDNYLTEAELEKLINTYSPLGYKYPEYGEKMTNFIQNIYFKLSEK